MANTYKWNINALEAKISQDSKDNVVHTIHWSYTATDDSEKPIMASSIGTHGVQYDADNFKAYADLKESDVIGWLEAGIDVEAIKTNLDEQIELQKNPTDKTFSTPFATPTE